MQSGVDSPRGCLKTWVCTRTDSILHGQRGPRVAIGWLGLSFSYNFKASPGPATNPPQSMTLLDFDPEALGCDQWD
jgi:hypothetical protein